MMRCKEILSIIVTVCFLTTSVVAKPPKKPSIDSLSCKSGEGIWKKTDDSFVCRPCSSLDSYSAHEMIKMPKGCTPMTWGVFMTLNNYYDLKKDKAYYLQLDNFLSAIQPSLDQLSNTTNELLDKSERLSLDLGEARKKMSNLEQKNVELQTKNDIIKWLAISGGVVALGSTAFLISVLTK